MSRKSDIIIMSGLVIGVIMIIMALVSLAVYEATTVIAEGTVMDWKEIPRVFGGGYDYMVLLNNGKWYDIQENAYFVLELGQYIQVLKNGAVIIL